MSNMNLYDTIPNNVNLSDDKKLKRALEKWLPDFQSWWMDMGPEGFQANDVYLRTAIDVDPKGWAHFDHVKMPDYRWGIFLAAQEKDRKIGFGDHMGKPVWQEVPGEYRGMLRRLIVTQADTEPASVEQQRLLGQTCPSLYDLRNLFQVNVEEGRHLWAMVYLLHGYFGRDGREEAEALLARRSGNPDKPRILGAFNEPIEDWLSFFMFTMFTDRDGKYQLLALAESGFDPLSRTTRFMLTEEAHHMFVGETGVGRVVERTAQLMKEGNDDVRKAGGVDLPLIQKYLNLWFTLSLDLFGGEVSSNAADFFASGLKGRQKEDRLDEHTALDQYYNLNVFRDGKRTMEEVPLRNALNEVLRDSYVDDCQRGVDRWNKTLEEHGINFELKLPHRSFHRHIGEFANVHFDPEGNFLSDEEWDKRKDEFLPSEEDKVFVKSLMHAVREPGKIANWIAPPKRGINGQPFEFEYVRLS
ncbi:MAG: benzoyl-CoA 2,3-epoxidase subunit BoxB [Candidatus Eisenbacteria bacterium]|uniref:Benzoyl-CoA 2,3-epoxidase subunit BoxB n=1 Tax=Eiseniibacteriota bacterium TaxID=2212470 RepID=A0A7Y2H253_UNCEI|nr:benzoyl-CoA 2,3-epoxidase subunit BoxB [Candidatus Eisenbacteria bacterium]